MAQIVIPDEALIREPGLLVPGRTPVGPVKIDWSHPLARGLKFCFGASGGPVNLVTGNRLGGNWNPVPTRAGLAHDVNGLSGNVLTSSDLRVMGSSVTHFSFAALTIDTNLFDISSTEDLIGNSNSGNTQGFRVFSPIDSGSLDYLRFRLCGGSSNVDITKADMIGASWSNGDYALYTGTYNSVTHIFTVYNKDKKNSKTSSASETQAQDFASNDFAIGEHLVGSGQTSPGKFFLVAVWSVALTEAQLDAFNRDPYQFLVPA